MFVFFMCQCGWVNPHYSNLECVMCCVTELNRTVLYCAKLNFGFLKKRWLDSCPSRASVVVPSLPSLFCFSNHRVKIAKYQNLIR